MFLDILGEKINKNIELLPNRRILFWVLRIKEQKNLCSKKIFCLYLYNPYLFLCLIWKY